MKKPITRVLAVFILLLVSAILLFSANLYYESNVTQSEGSCEFKTEWITNPSMPSKVDKTGSDGNSSFCDFYQFSWQAFMYLVSPDDAVVNSENINSYPAVFDNEEKYPLLQASGNSCSRSAKQKRSLFLRSTKPVDPAAPMTSLSMPERIGQAGGGAVIYDQNGYAAFYEVRFSRNMCDFAKITQELNFPNGTTEMKMAWKVLLNNSEKDDFYHINADVEGVGTDITLGLIGYHIAIATDDHPEMIWISFEHNRNNPLCHSDGDEGTSDILKDQNNWSFTSEKCATTIADSNPLWSMNSFCSFNKPDVTVGDSKEIPVTGGKPTEICQVYRNGTLPDRETGKPVKNDIVIDKLYQKFTTLDQTVVNENSWVKVWKENYRMIGALWLTQPAENGGFNPSKDKVNIDNPEHFQRGSLALANPVMETEFQQPPNLVNCFGCHGFSSTTTNTSPTKSSLSHIFDDIVQGQCPGVKVPGGAWGRPEERCPAVCESYGGWSGQYSTSGEAYALSCQCWGAGNEKCSVLDKEGSSK